MTEKKDSKNELGDALLKVVDRAHEEISWVRSAYKFVVVIVSALIAVGLYFSYNSFRDLRSDLKEDGKRVQQQLQTDIESLGRSLQQNLNTETAKLRQEVSARIDQEFKREEISSLVQQKAKERIDLIADKLIAEETAKRVTPLKEELTQLITRMSDDIRKAMADADKKQEQSQTTEKALQDALAEARQTLSNIKMQSDFMMTVVAAQTDDRFAYDKLNEWVAGTNDLLRTQASRVKDTITREYSGWLGDKPYKTIGWADGVTPTNFSFAEIKQIWIGVPSDRARAFVEFVWNHPKPTMDEKCDFLHDVLKDSRNSLQAADKAARLLSDHAKVAYNPPFEFGKVNQWWDEWSKTGRTDRTTNKAPDATR